jgi:adenylate kinase
MDAGDLVPDELTTKMLIDEVNKHPDTNGILFDGYPRTLSRVALDAFMISIDSKVTATIALEADDEMIQRLLERGKTSGRIDDQDEDKIRNRYQEYNEKTAPLMQYYNDQGSFMP